MPPSARYTGGMGSAGGSRTGVASVGRSRTGVERLPDVVTLTRPVIGVACGLAVATGHAAAAGALYLLGYLSDVLDGWLARRLAVSSEDGTRRDGVADELFHLAVGLGLLWWGFTAPAPWVVAWVLGLLVLVRLVRRGIRVRTVWGKVVGGATRVLVFAVFVLLAAPGQRLLLALLGLVVLGTTYVYELRVTLDEGATGARPLR